MGSCKEKNWSPDVWTTPIVTFSGNFVYVTQSFLWYTDSINAFKAKGGSYIYEVRRSPSHIDVWDFVRPGFLYLYCFYEFSTNLPSVSSCAAGVDNEEADIWLRILCLLTGDNEEAELGGPISELQANKWYYVCLKFYRKQKNVSFTLSTEIEWCGGPFYCWFGSKFEWCRMTANTIKS